MLRGTIAILIMSLLLPGAAAAQEGFGFEIEEQVRTTPVKNQARTGTCWSFASSSFMETELLRLGKQPVDLSEMFFVRMTYPQKVRNYVRLHGNAALGEGSLGGDVFRAVREYGAVPESVYPGRRYGAERHDHGELIALVRAAADALVQRRQLSPVWPDAIDGILDAYLGEVPEQFVYEGKTYTPRSFADELGLSPQDYVELTSFNHHPYYTWFAVEVPDNWARNQSYNVPLDELMGVIDDALERGYSVDWDGDVSERSFCHGKGVAVLPLQPWGDRSQEAQERVCTVPEAEVQVTQEVRQQGFDDHTSTDDHLMHLVGIARDRDGTKYYLTKNSWGVTGAEDGFLYMSEAYVRAKTITIVVHREALPAGLTGKVAQR
jgi:bleomycin hydrolase